VVHWAVPEMLLAEPAPFPAEWDLAATQMAG